MDVQLRRRATELARLNQAQVNVVSKYNLQQPEAQQQRFAECMQALDSRLSSGIAIGAKYIAIPIMCEVGYHYDVGSFFLQATNDFELTYSFNNGATETKCKLRHTDEYLNQKLFNKNFVDKINCTLVVFEILYNDGTELLSGANLPEMKLKITLTDGTNRVLEQRLGSFFLTPTLSHANETGLKYLPIEMPDDKRSYTLYKLPPNVEQEIAPDAHLYQINEVTSINPTPHFVFGLKFVDSKRVLNTYNEKYITITTSSDLQEFVRAEVSSAQINPGPPIRAHLYTKRQRISEGEMEFGQQMLDHEIRDHDHSPYWWAGKISKIAAKYVNVAATKGKDYYKYPDNPVVKDEHPFTLERSKVNTILIKVAAGNTGKETIKSCNGFFTSSLAADGNILNGGVTSACLHLNGIDIVTDNKLAGILPFFGMDDPADKFALSIPNVVKVIASPASAQMTGMGGSASATVMQIGSAKKLTAFARHLLSRLASRAEAARRNITSPLLDETQCLHQIARALADMRDAHTKGKPGDMDKILDTIAESPSFQKFLGNPSASTYLRGEDTILYKYVNDDDPVQLWPLTMVLGLRDQSDLHALMQVEDVHTVELFTGVDPKHKRWMLGSCISDKYEISLMALNGVSST